MRVNGAVLFVTRTRVPETQGPQSLVCEAMFSCLIIYSAEQTLPTWRSDLIGKNPVGEMRETIGIGCRDVDDATSNGGELNKNALNSRLSGNVRIVYF